MKKVDRLAYSLLMYMYIVRHAPAVDELTHARVFRAKRARGKHVVPFHLSVEHARSRATFHDFISFYPLFTRTRAIRKYFFFSRRSAHVELQVHVLRERMFGRFLANEDFE